MRRGALGAGRGDGGWRVGLFRIRMVGEGKGWSEMGIETDRAGEVGLSGAEEALAASLRPPPRSLPTSYKLMMFLGFHAVLHVWVVC